MSWQNNIPSDITNAQLIERIIVYETFLSTIHNDIQNFSNLLNRYVKEGNQQNILDSIKTSSEEIQMYVINNKPKLSFVSNVAHKEAHSEKKDERSGAIVRALRSKKAQTSVDLSSLTHFTQLALPQKVKLKQASQNSDFQRKDYILNELITTEIDYINDLGVIVGYYEKPLQEEFKHILSEQNISSIFRNIDAILDVHKELLTKLRIEQRKPDARDVGRVFIDMFENKLKGIYLIFNNNLTVADDCLMKCYKENSAFAEYAEQVRILPESRNQSLDMLLIKPFQRNNRYPILLKKLLDQTPEGNERNVLQEAWSMLEREVKVKRNADTLAQTLELKNRFLIISQEDKELNHLHKHVFVDQIAVKEIDGKKLRKAQILLFKDVLIIAREKGKNLIRKFYSPLNLVSLKESKNVLEVKSKLHQPVQVAFSTQLERNKWVQIITAHIAK